MKALSTTLGGSAVASSKSRQRAMARAKVERQIARRAAAARRRRQVQAGIGVGLVVVLVAVGVAWATGLFSHKPKTPITSAGACAWTTLDTGSNANLKDVGTPPTTDIPKTGTETMTVTTNQGVVTAQLDLEKASCTAASFAFLSGQKFFDNTKCHRLTTQGIFVLQCGDPSGTGNGGPAYKFPDEYRPLPPQPTDSASGGPSGGATPTPAASTTPTSQPLLYPRGSLAMANSGADTNGSQFFIVYKDSPLPANYTLFGTVTQGLDVIDKVAAAGNDGAFDPQPGGGHPKTEVVIQSLTVSAAPASPTGATPTPSATPSAS
jgi:peptidyl-prolyl cis-trans isomerase B (cyclophilin B)